MEKIAILGGGAGGLACASELSMTGHSTNLFELPRFKSPHIEAIQKRGGIEVEGLRKGLAELNLVTTDIRKAIRGVDIVLIITPAYGTETFCETCIPHLEDGQTVIFHGKGGHTLEFVKISKKLGVKKKVMLGETHTLPLGTRLTGRGKVTIYSRIRFLLSSAFPARDTEKIVATLEKLYQSNPPYNYRIVSSENVLALVLCDLNAIRHPPKVLFNLSRVESPMRDFKIYVEGETPSITKIKEAIEKERLAVMAGFGLRPVPSSEIESPEDLRTPEELELRKIFREYVVVSSIKERFISEDVPYGLVTIASLADMVGVQTPLIDSIINISCAMTGVNYWKTGRTTKTLGLVGLSLYEIRKLLDEGTI